MKADRKENHGRAFRVTITETLQRTITIYESELKEPTPDEAAQMASDWWHNSQIVLEAEDFAGVDFTAEEIGDSTEETDSLEEMGGEV
jgi:hypothetical protein